MWNLDSSEIQQSSCDSSYLLLPPQHLSLHLLFLVSGTINIFQARTLLLFVHKKDNLTLFPCLFRSPWLVPSSTKVVIFLVLSLHPYSHASSHTLIHTCSHVLSHMSTHTHTHIEAHTHTFSSRFSCTICKLGSVITVSGLWLLVNEKILTSTVTC